MRIGVEEVGASQVRVAIGLAGPDLCRVDLALEPRVQARVPIELEPAVDVLEHAAYPSDHHVHGAELDFRVAGLQDPSGHGTRALTGFNDEGDLVDEAPGPVLTGLQRRDDRMLLRGGVLRGVPVGGGVAAADLAAGTADAQVDPGAADAQALLATGELLRRINLDLVEVSAGGHVPSLAGVTSP